MSFRLNYAAKVVGGCGMVAFLGWMLFVKEKAAVTLLPAGWPDLSGCSELVSIDGSKRLSLFENHVVKMYGRTGSGTIESGTWAYRDQSKQYAMLLADQIWNYDLVSPDGSDTCMLVNGDIETANLKTSWFSVNAEYDASRDDDHGAR